MTPTRCETTTAERCADQPAASRNRSTASAIGQFDTIASAVVARPASPAAGRSPAGPASGARRPPRKRPGPPRPRRARTSPPTAASSQRSLRRRDRAAPEPGQDPRRPGRPCRPRGPRERPRRTGGGAPRPRRARTRSAGEADQRRRPVPPSADRTSSIGAAGNGTSVLPKSKRDRLDAWPSSTTPRPLSLFPQSFRALAGQMSRKAQ